MVPPYWISEGPYGVPVGFWGFLWVLMVFGGVLWVSVGSADPHFPPPQLWEDKEGKKRMNKNNAKALSTLRQKIRKHNRDYEGLISAYRQVGGTWGAIWGGYGGF